MKLWIVFRQVSDQYGTSEVAAVCTSEGTALSVRGEIRNKQTYIREVESDTIYGERSLQ